MIKRTEAARLIVTAGSWGLALWPAAPGPALQRSSPRLESRLMPPGTDGREERSGVFRLDHGFWSSAR
eukprot:15430977-Alexandrium_andersonii.AAC.1